MLTWLGYIFEWVSDIGGDSCYWHTGIGIFWVKSTPFKFAFVVENLADIKSWVNEYLEVELNSIWIVPSICCIIFKGVVKGLIGFERVKSLNSHWILNNYVLFIFLLKYLSIFLIYL